MSGFHPFGGRVSHHFGSLLSPDDAYLSYHDVRLMKEDVDCIKNDWLTDNAISFWQEYLENEKLKRFPRSHIILLRPSMCFMLVQTRDPLTLKEALPAFKDVSHIFLPVNDCTSPTQPEGGSHWSLLLVSVRDGVAFHYDSLRPSNYRHGEIATAKLSRLLGRSIRFLDLQDSPQQDNGADCGVYVCLLIKILLDRLLLRDSTEQVGMSVRNSEVDASRGRKDMLKLIEGFRKEGKRSASRSPSRDGRRSGSRTRTPPRVGD